MMRNVGRCIALPVLLAAVVVSPTMSAVKGKTHASPTNRARLGTKQLNGENAQLGVTYTLGKANPINITLDKVEYTLEPVQYGDTTLWTRAGEKTLVLHYTLHNPNPSDYGLSWNTVWSTVVDANDRNWQQTESVAMEATHERCNMSLKPAQKTKVYTSITIPAQGGIPKLIIQSRDKLVLRYDLRGKIKPLPAVIADPADPSGASVLERIPAQIGVYYPFRWMHAKVDSIGLSTDPVAGRSPKKGGSYLVIIGTAKNSMPGRFRFGWNTLQPKVTDMDGGDLHWGQDVYYASRDDTINADMETGKELRFRFAIEVPSGVVPSTLSLTQGDGHSYIYDLSQVK